MDIVTLAKYPEVVQAELAKMFLESEGIESFVVDNNAGSLQIYGVIGIGIRVQVRQEDLKRARLALEKFKKDKGNELSEDELMAAFEQDAADRGEPALETGPDEVVGRSAQLNDESTCPKCGGTRFIKERDFGFGLFALTFLLVGLPLLFIKPNLVCSKCGHNLG